MNHLRTLLLLGASVGTIVQPAAPASSPDESVMLVAVSRDQAMLVGGISSSNLDRPGKMSPEEATSVRKALRLKPGRLDSLQGLRFFSVRLETKDFVVIQRAFSDIPDALTTKDPRLVFAIGAMDGERLEILQWKRNVEDENERILGTIRLKSGRDFLLTSVTDPESQTFRIYGFKEGRLVRVFSGGGGSC